MSLFADKFSLLVLEKIHKLTDNLNSTTGTLPVPVLYSRFAMAQTDGQSD